MGGHPDWFVGCRRTRLADAMGTRSTVSAMDDPTELAAGHGKMRDGPVRWSQCSVKILFSTEVGTGTQASAFAAGK